MDRRDARSPSSSALPPLPRSNLRHQPNNGIPPQNNSYTTNNGNRPNHHVNNYNGKNRSSGGYTRISPTAEVSPSHTNQHEELINYICESWDKVSRECDRGGLNDAKYFESNGNFNTNFIPFDLEALWRRRHGQNIKRQQHNS